MCFGAEKSAPSFYNKEMVGTNPRKIIYFTYSVLADNIVLLYYSNASI